MATWEELQRLHDGELSPEEAERLRARLDDADRLRLEALREVTEATRGVVRARAEHAPAPSVWSAIEGKLEASVVPLRPGRQRRSRLWAASGVAALLAVAAAVFLLVGTPAATGGAATIESVEFGEGSHVLFQVHETDTTVLWQTSEEGIE
jgi:hypothetical protein